MMERVLLIGYGNPGRIDDGLGPALAREVAALGLDGVTVEEAYQLAVEDAAAAAEHDVVVFADAAAAGPGPFRFTPVAPDGTVRFTTHSVSPGAVLAMAREHFDAEPRGWLLAIRGHEFDGFGEALSPRAAKNLAAAAHFVGEALAARRFEEVRP
jgi:hydrogenase maturation protease